MFGARRQVLSGSSGRDDRSTSDSTHEVLYLETKLRASHAASALFAEVTAAARREGKTPVLALAVKGKPGFLLVVRPEDLATIAAELVNPEADEPEAGDA